MGIEFPLGMDSFQKVRSTGRYYVDKTGFICRLLENTCEVNLVTRPRRFGKTLAMSMLEDFFDIRRDSREDFEGLKINQHPELCAAWMNQWPVVSLTLKSVEGNHYESAYGMLKTLISDLCTRYSFLEHSENIDDDDRVRFRRLKSECADDTTVKSSLYILMRMMHAHYGRQAILLIDEYDVPLAKASEAGYYREMLEIIRAMLGKALKTNEFLKFAVITGCLKIAKESIFTGTNNFVSDTIMGDRFDEYFGFTEQDVQKLLSDTGFTKHASEIRDWYDGYRFGMTDVYCPWDVLNHVAALQLNPLSRPQSYWENTSHNGIIRKIIERNDLRRNEHLTEDFETLIAGGCIIKEIKENITYDTAESSADNLWSLLYLTGYLTRDTSGGDVISEKETALKIPNEEVRGIFKSSVLEWFENSVRADSRKDLFDALWGMDEQACSRILSKKVFDTISCYDYREDFYHAFVAGILSYAGYKILSNREQGEGRSDILLTDEQLGRAIVIEIKVSENLRGMELKCDEAIRQIYDRRYAEALTDEYEEIICYGICFYKKRCLVKGKRYME